MWGPTAIILSGTVLPRTPTHPTVDVWARSQWSTAKFDCTDWHFVPSRDPHLSSSPAISFQCCTCGGEWNCTKRTQKGKAGSLPSSAGLGCWNRVSHRSRIPTSTLLHQPDSAWKTWKLENTRKRVGQTARSRLYRSHGVLCVHNITTQRKARHVSEFKVKQHKPVLKWLKSWGGGGALKWVNIKNRFQTKWGGFLF